ncbi:MAG: DUF3105 domain-containing protein [Candidatus Eremiobacteraeota bacterium]|nr:DUF3105 domain-containing protein [Candidatus Eremiobacteraeota bacterium]MBC5827036.1 DUF3105 domain-containing protein [Candidatus Eremiobacteraeota bacterium]
MPKAKRVYGTQQPTAAKRPNGRLVAAAAVVVVVLIAFGLWVRERAAATGPDGAAATQSPAAEAAGSSSGASVAFTGKAYHSQGHDHLELKELTRFRYNSDPPTSGPHREVFSDTFVSPTPLPKFIQVHLLEHGNVLLQYNCTCPDIASALAGIAATYNDRLLPPNELQPLPTDVQNGEQQGQAVIVAPYPAMKYKIALTAWTRLATLESPDRVKITSFIDAYLHNGANLAQ